ncbi:MAG: 5-(carboxyamino)imidazole ribonucleotide mutase [Planctomycetes bacterium]|nr:5-(carboxyamino)imidazole ribonucleotide mutase [Planctomycetota bacterium]MCB9918463.1 5-(carboxyamino)imidazole ribonucleotide mutase [Planctomycetota bacterium]
MKPIVYVLGSDSDLPQLEGGFELLRHFELGFDVRVLSAHRTPHECAELASSAEAQGARVLIAAAGMAAALPGVLAAHSPLPVIGVPIGGSALSGVDALYSISQMPGGVPVATTGIGKAGGKNAALIAVRILALQDADLMRRYKEWIDDQRKAVLAKDREVQARYGSDA